MNQKKINKRKVFVDLSVDKRAYEKIKQNPQKTDKKEPTQDDVNDEDISNSTNKYY